MRQPDPVSHTNFDGAASRRGPGKATAKQITLYQCDIAAGPEVSGLKPVKYVTWTEPATTREITEAFKYLARERIGGLQAREMGPTVPRGSQQVDGYMDTGSTHKEASSTRPTATCKTLIREKNKLQLQRVLQSEIDTGRRATDSYFHAGCIGATVPAVEHLVGFDRLNNAQKIIEICIGFKLLAWDEMCKIDATTFRRLKAEVARFSGSCQRVESVGDDGRTRLFRRERRVDRTGSV